jgi:Nuclease-related domain
MNWAVFIYIFLKMTIERKSKFKKKLGVLMFFSKFFSKKKKAVQTSPVKTTSNKAKEHLSVRKGELGEYKITIQLSQLSKEYMVLNDILLPNPKAKSGYSQIDHVVLSPYGIFVIETKNFQGTIYGSPEYKQWLINEKFKFMNPFVQNYGHIACIKTLVGPKFKDAFVSIVSFTKRCTFKTDLSYRKIQSSELLIYDVELTETIKRKEAVIKLKNPMPLMSNDEIKECYSLIAQANIVEETIRKLHIDTFKSKV